MTIQAGAYAPPQSGPRTAQGLSFLVHGLPKAGKSTFADSGPKPGVILDVEGASYWTPSRKIYWDPVRQPVPVPDGSWDSAIVLARDSRTVMDLYAILNSGRHPFNSVSVDSITEVQQRIIDDLAGDRKIDRDHWGTLLRQVSGMARRYRDLVTHPVRPLWSVAFTAGTRERNGRWGPLVQGQVGDYLPYYVDILGYVQAMPDSTRHMLIGPHPQFETGERVGGLLPYSLQLGKPPQIPGYTIEQVLMQVMKGS